MRQVLNGRLAHARPRPFGVARAGLVCLLLAALLAGGWSHAAEPATPAPEPAPPAPPTEPTCQKQVSKKVMSGGQVNTVMVDVPECVAAWDRYNDEGCTSSDHRQLRLRLLAGVDGHSHLSLRLTPPGAAARSPARK